MSGYSGYSMSNNARNAQACGRFPASKIAKMFGVPVEFVRRRCPQSGEWHHTSSRYNVTDYYDSDAVAEYLDTEKGQQDLAEIKAEISTRETIIYQNCLVRWVEWSGTRRHPKAIDREESGCIVTDKGGSFLEIQLPNGNVMRKKRDGNGFSFKTQ